MKFCSSSNNVTAVGSVILINVHTSRAITSVTIWCSAYSVDCHVVLLSADIVYPLSNKAYLF